VEVEGGALLVLIMDLELGYLLLQLIMLHIMETQVVEHLVVVVVEEGEGHLVLVVVLELI